MILHLCGINIFVNGFNLGFLIVLNLLNIIRYLISKEESEKRDIIGILILPLLLLVNFYLFDNGIYIPEYIVVFSGIGITYMYHLNRLGSTNKLIKIGFLCILLIGFFSTDYYMYSNRLIKDINFNRTFKREFNINGKINKENLKDIEKLSIGSRFKVNTLNGIEHFIDLKKLSIWDGNLIKNYTPLNKLSNLEHLMLWYIDLNDLDKLSKLESLEHLEIIYPKRGNIKNLNNFPNLRQLEIQGLNVENLNLISGPKHIEILGVADISQISFEGIDQFTELKELRLYKLKVIDMNHIFKLDNLKEISIQDCDIADYEEFRNWTKENGIKVDVRDPINFQIYN